MKKLTILLIILFPFSYSITAKTTLEICDSPDVIDNQTLVSLTKSGFGADVIIGYMNTSPTNFNCSMSALIALKKDSVPEKVLVEVTKRCSSQNKAAETVANSNNPLEKHDGGIFCYQLKDSSIEYELKRLYTTVISGQKSGGVGAAIASSYTYGLSKSSVKAELSGSSAIVKLKSTGVFYFYFDATTQDVNNASTWWFRTATSPNEFSLIKLKSKKDVREYKMGTANAYTEKTGIDQDQKIAFTFEEIKPGIFKVIVTKPLLPGEYCFIYSAAVPSMYTNDKVFDFSITK
jgi:hypothetical protein